MAAAAAEKRKHVTYNAECAKRGWKLVPFALEMICVRVVTTKQCRHELKDASSVLESLDAKGFEATQLLQRMSAHAIGRSPVDFLLHADGTVTVDLPAGLNSEITIASV